eukprot:17504_1
MWTRFSGGVANRLVGRPSARNCRGSGGGWTSCRFPSRRRWRGRWRWTRTSFRLLGLPDQRSEEFRCRSDSLWIQVHRKAAGLFGQLRCRRHIGERCVHHPRNARSDRRCCLGTQPTEIYRTSG